MFARSEVAVSINMKLLSLENLTKIGKRINE